MWLCLLPFPLDAPGIVPALGLWESNSRAAVVYSGAKWPQAVRGFVPLKPGTSGLAASVPKTPWVAACPPTPPAPTLQLIAYPDSWQTPFCGIVLSVRGLAFDFFFFPVRKREQKSSQFLDVQLQVLAQLLGTCLSGSSEAASETENLAFPGCSTLINIDGHPEFTVSALRPSSLKTTSIHSLQVRKVTIF